MRVIARGTLNDFVTNRVARAQQAVVKAHLDAWHERAIKAEWKSSAELKSQFGTASILSAERVVFNIKGNDYRLVVLIDYYYQGVLVLWLGTHAEYDKIDAREVKYDKKRYRSPADSN
ncbi:MAG TPA: type II toxin-antitoxin system HigB family toxin [Acidobacteriaceae bacterium]